LGKYRKKYGKWVVYYQKPIGRYGLDLMEIINQELIEEIVKECKSGDRFYKDTLQKFPLLRKLMDGTGVEHTQEYPDNRTKWVWKIDPSRRPHFFPIW
jgi:hypothetical protein